MASGLIFDPLVVLRAAPLVSSTCSLLYAWDQHFFLSILNRPENRKLSKPLLPSYFNTFFHKGVWIVLGCLAVTSSTSVANLYTQRSVLRARDSFWWYVGGAALSIGHLLFVPLIAPSVQRTVEAKPDSEPDANASLDDWLSINFVRMVTVDLAAWLAVGVAVVKTLRA